VVAQEQRQWAQAEEYYRQALAIKIEFNARYEQAATYHQLGSVAQEQRQRAQAESLSAGVGDLRGVQRRYEQAGTYHQLGVVAQEQRQWAQARSIIGRRWRSTWSSTPATNRPAPIPVGPCGAEQRQWRRLKSIIGRRLAIKIEFNARYEQAATYHQLGRVAQEQRQWAQAEEFIGRRWRSTWSSTPARQAGTYHS